MPEFMVTFGQRYAHEIHPRFGDAHPDGWVTVEAADYGQARARVIGWLGREWSWLYTADDFQPEFFPRGELHRITAVAPLRPAKRSRSGTRRSRSTARGVVLSGRPDRRQTVAPPQLKAGQQRCPVCRNGATLTPLGFLRRHRDLFGHDCTNRRAG
jgi:hypothetical protein